MVVMIRGDVFREPSACVGVACSYLQSLAQLNGVSSYHSLTLAACRKCCSMFDAAFHMTNSSRLLYKDYSLTINRTRVDSDLLAR